jgi:hypothetical protein
MQPAQQLNSTGIEAYYAALATADKQLMERLKIACELIMPNGCLVMDYEVIGDRELTPQEQDAKQWAKMVINITNE